jgi:hypothetical protein
MQKRDAPASFAARAAAITVGRSSIASSATKVFRASAGLDRDQRRQLDGVARVMRAMDLLRLEQQVGKRQREQIANGGNAPARANGCVTGVGTRRMKGDGGVVSHAFGWWSTMAGARTLSTMHAAHSVDEALVDVKFCERII